MEIEKVFEGIRYTLSNDNLRKGDKVFPIARGRIVNDKKFILGELDYREIISGFPNEPHTIINLKHSDYKPYQVQTDHGYSPIESYYKIIKKEKQVKKGDYMFAGWEWIEITEEENEKTS